MSSPKFRVALGSILIVAAPLALFLNRYLQSNPLESLFALDTVQTIVLTTVLSLFGIIFVYLAGMIIPGMFSLDANEPLDYSAWAIGCGVVMAMFVSLCLSMPVSNRNDPRNKIVDNRSYYMFVDNDNVVHYDPDCLETYYDGDQWEAIYYSFNNLDIDIRDYDICAVCTWVFYDYAEDIAHFYEDCISLSIKEQENLSRRQITEIFKCEIDLCPYCY